MKLYICIALKHVHTHVVYPVYIKTFSISIYIKYIIVVISIVRLEHDEFDKGFPVFLYAC